MRKIKAKVEAILVADQSDTFETRRLNEVDVEFGGIRGDRHFGMTAVADSRKPMYKRGTEILNRRQISILSMEECEEIARNLGIEEVKPEWLGANILLSGVPNFTTIGIGSRLLFEDEAGLLCEGENLPCKHPGEMIEKYNPEKVGVASAFVKAANKKRGIVCMVEKQGKIKVGDEVQILINDPEKPMQ